MSSCFLLFTAGSGIRHILRVNISSFVLRKIHVQLSKTATTKSQISRLNINQCRTLTDQAVKTREDENPYVPRRTLMYVPGHDMKKLNKIPHLNVDCAVLECEDGVAVNMKVFHHIK